MKKNSQQHGYDIETASTRRDGTRGASPLSQGAVAFAEVVGLALTHEWIRLKDGDQDHDHPHLTNVDHRDRYQTFVANHQDCP